MCLFYFYETYEIYFVSKLIKDIKFGKGNNNNGSLVRVLDYLKPDFNARVTVLKEKSCTAELHDAALLQAVLIDVRQTEPALVHEFYYSEELIPKKILNLIYLLSQLT